MRKRGNKPQKLERDLAGYVHTGRGFVAPADYKRIVRENPDAGLPEYEEIPLMSMPPYNDVLIDEFAKQSEELEAKYAAAPESERPPVVHVPRPDNCKPQL